MAATHLVSAGDDPAAALTTEFLRATGALFTADSVQDTLTGVAVTAVTTIEGCDFAGIFLARLGTAGGRYGAGHRRPDAGP